MFTFFRILLRLVWSLWFGGMLALLLFVTRLFNASHDIGVSAAPILFRTFANAQIIVGSVATALAITCIFATAGRSRAMIVATAFLLIALAMTLPIRSWTNRIDAMRDANQTKSPEFKSLHARSGIGYVVSATALFLAGVSIALDRSGMPRTRSLPA